jgi:hypothetical protein
MNDQNTIYKVGVSLPGMYKIASLANTVTVEMSSKNNGNKEVKETKEVKDKKEKSRSLVEKVKLWKKAETANNNKTVINLDQEQPDVKAKPVLLPLAERKINALNRIAFNSTLWSMKPVEPEPLKDSYWLKSMRTLLKISDLKIDNVFSLMRYRFSVISSQLGVDIREWDTLEVEKIERRGVIFVTVSYTLQLAETISFFVIATSNYLFAPLMVDDFSQITACMERILLSPEYTLLIKFSSSLSTSSRKFVKVSSGVPCNGILETCSNVAATISLCTS